MSHNAEHMDQAVRKATCGFLVYVAHSLRSAEALAPVDELEESMPSNTKLVSAITEQTWSGQTLARKLNENRVPGPERHGGPRTAVVWIRGCALAHKPMSAP